MTTSTLVEPDKASKSGRRLRWAAGLVVSVLGLCAGLMRWGGYLLVSEDLPPAHADAAVVLEGSLLGERARLAGAMDLLRKEVPGRVLLTLPEMSYWGEPVPPMARRFLENTYGHDLAERVDFCFVSPDVDSTLQEAYSIGNCIREHHWRSVIVVTSNYHSRRAALIWRRVMGKEDPSLQIWVRGVADTDFEPDGWWKKRLWAKTWLLEFTKLVWAETVGR